MNKKLVFHSVGTLLLVEAICMVPSFLIALLYGDGDAKAMLLSIACACALGLPLHRLLRGEGQLRAREGLAITALSWIVLSAVGALPFFFSGLLPDYVDAFFEAVSGFTTTGASVLTSFEGLPHGVIFWRSFTHWIGGMGILVLSMAVLPSSTNGRSAHLMRAESPGPTLSKVAPKLHDTAKILYTIYFALTFIEFGALLLCGMSPYDAAIHAIGTAGTGGFSNYGSSVGAFDSVAVEVVITVFMLLFGVNFALFYRLLQRDVKGVLHSEELRWYLGIAAGAILLITLFILPSYGTFGNALRYASFQVASVMSTTGYATADYNSWCIQAKMLIFVLMFIGSCAGSTAGGMKVVRVSVMFKQGYRQILRTLQPRKVKVVRYEGEGMEESQLHQIAMFCFIYILLMLIGAFVVSLEGLYDLETNLTAALTCISNVGPGLGLVGPASNFAGYGPFAKLVLSLLMLAGRL